LEAAVTAMEIVSPEQLFFDARFRELRGVL
jgi:hypothetical protein